MSGPRLLTPRQISLLRSLKRRYEELQQERYQALAELWKLRAEIEDDSHPILDESKERYDKAAVAVSEVMRLEIELREFIGLPNEVIDAWLRRRRMRGCTRKLWPRGRPMRPGRRLRVFVCMAEGESEEGGAEEELDFEEEDGESNGERGEGSA